VLWLCSTPISPRVSCLAEVHVCLFSDLQGVDPHSPLDKSPLGFLLEQIVVRNEVLKNKKEINSALCHVW